MIARPITMLTLAGLAACSAEPRSAAYFEANPDEAEQVIADCKTGTHRGEECVNAPAGVAAAARTARKEAYRKGF